MKVLFVSSGNRGIDPIMLSQGRSLEDQGIDILYFGIIGKGLLGYVKNIPKLYNFIKRNNPDLIHAHYGLSAFVAFFAKGNRKLVVSFMGSDLLEPIRINGKINFKNLLIKKINQFLANHYYKYAIVKSHQMSEVIKTPYKKIIPNGVDLSLFKPMDKKQARKILGVNPSERVIIFVSNPSRYEKNYSLVDLAIKRTRLSNINLKVVFNINQIELVNYYSMTDVLVLSSLHEGSPNVIKEAMACNCPIVATNVGDVNWVIGGVEGCFVSSFEVDEFAGKLRNALDFAEKNGRTTGRNRIKELGLDSISIAKRVIEVYDDVIGS